MTGLCGELRLLEAAAGFEAIDQPSSPATCTVVGPVRRDKLVTTLRGTDSVSDFPHVLALECACRLRRDRDTPVRLTTSQRVVRAQEIPKRPDDSHHLRLFTLATGDGSESTASWVDALIEHVRALRSGFDELTQEGDTFRRRSVRLLATAAAAPIASPNNWHQSRRRLRAARSPYYDGLRFTIERTAADGSVFPIAEGGLRPSRPAGRQPPPGVRGEWTGRPVGDLLFRR